MLRGRQKMDTDKDGRVDEEEWMKFLTETHAAKRAKKKGMGDKASFLSYRRARATYADPQSFLGSGSTP